MMKRKETTMEQIPTYSFYKDDIQPNGNLSEHAIVRECQGVYHPRLMSELKYLDHANKPITIRIGDKEVFRVKFFNQDKT